jgi:tetratricopeptide (TPR) repeat protein
VDEELYVSQKKSRKDRARGKQKPSVLRQQLREAMSLIRQGYLLDAADLLAKLDRPHPEQAEVLALRIDVAALLREHALAQRLAERLVVLKPRDPEARLRLAGTCMANLRPAMAIPEFRRVLELRPDHPEAERVRSEIVQLEAMVRHMAAGTGLDGPDVLAAWAVHERVQVHLERGEFEQTVTLADELLQSYPRCGAAWNNAALALFQLGDVAGARARVLKVLEFAPDNLHALAGLVRYELLLGHPAEARETAARLQALKVNRDDGWLKIAEALSYLGDDEGVLRAVGRGRESPAYREPTLAALLEHLAAVAHYRLGDEAEARRCWERSLQRTPHFDTARDNLEDLRRAPGKRHAPWAFSLPYWLPPSTHKELVDGLALLGAGRKREAEYREEVRAFLARHPELEEVLLCLLDRGDPQGRQWALSLSGLARTPRLLAGLRDFALSQRGPDDMRHQAARFANEANLLPAGPVRLWLQGEWREILLLSFEITPEPKKVHSAEVEALLAEAWEAQTQGEHARAEPLLRQALEREPDAPDLMNNLALSLEELGQHEESHALRQAIETRHPDYFSGRVARARTAVRQGRLDDAAEMLKSLQREKKMHTSEFSALAMLGIEYALARKQRPGAQQWLSMWEQVVPGHPDLPAMRRRIRDHDVRDLDVLR